MLARSLYAPVLMIAGTCATGCTTDVGQPTFQAALNGVVSDSELLAEACGRPIAEPDAKRAGLATKFSEFSSTRSVFGKDGTGQVKFTYTPPTGDPCTAEMKFSFHQETAAKQFTRRNVSYSSTIELTDIVVTAVK